MANHGQNELSLYPDSIVKTLNHHTRILERIERKLSARGNGRPGQQNGGGASPRR